MMKYWDIVLTTPHFTIKCLTAFSAKWTPPFRKGGESFDIQYYSFCSSSK